MFAYCLNNPVSYSDHNGKYIENHVITPYIEDGELKGFNVDNDERFLDSVYCIGFAEEYVKENGTSGRYADMTSERIALELYAHAELYYFGLSLEDPLSSDNAYYSSLPFDNPGAMAGAAVKKKKKNYLIDRGQRITVNNNESSFRMTIYKALWKNKTGREYLEEYK